MHKNNELNKNQVVVLEWLKENKDQDIFCMQLSDLFGGSGSLPDKVYDAYRALRSDKELFEIIAAYADWEIKKFDEAVED